LRVAMWFAWLTVVHLLYRLAEYVGVFSEQERLIFDVFLLVLLVIGCRNAIKRESEGDKTATAKKAAKLKKVIGFLKKVLDLLHKEF
jgi:hypothetical protein